MKIKYILICLFANIGLINAQYQNYVLKDPDPNTTSHSYIGRDYVRLTNGYKFTAVSGKTMNAKISSELSTVDANSFVAIALPPTGGSSDAVTAIDKNKAVGQIPISSSVSPNGAKCYNVPIEIVPGRLGFQPNISLSYNSQAGNGMVGMGWSISGLSSIERVNKNMFFDGKNDIPALSIEDAFVLDGVRLIENPNSRTTSQISFETVHGFTKVTAYITGDIVKYFKVLYPNGTIGIFGYDYNNNVSNLSYPITSLTDINASTITFSYDATDIVDLNSGTTNELYYIKEINYGYCYNSANFAKVKFNYDETLRPDQIFSLQAGKSCVYRKRLNKIESFANPDLIRTYQLTYSNIDPRLTSNQNDVSRLMQINCSASNESLNPLKFYYGEKGTLTTSVQSTALASSNFDLTKINMVRGKFDINSQNDALLVYPKKDVYSSPTIGETYSVIYPENENIKIYQNLNLSTSSPQIIQSEEGFVDILSANIDGAGHDELVKINVGLVESNEVIKFKIYKPILNSGLGLPRVESLTFDAVYYTENRIKRYSLSPRKYFSGNFTGKGYSEIISIPQSNIVIGSRGLSKTHIISLIENQTAITSNETFINQENEKIYPMDIDGDGQTELVHITSNNTDLYKYIIGQGMIWIGSWNLKLQDFDTREIFLTDLNGDGKTDIVMSPKLPVQYHHIYSGIDVGKTTVCPNCGALNQKYRLKSLLATDYSIVSGGPYTITCNECCHMYSYNPTTLSHSECGIINGSSRCEVILTNTDVYYTKNEEAFNCPVHGTSNNCDYYFTNPKRDNVWSYLFSDGINAPIVKTKVFTIGREFNHRYSIQDIDGDNTPELIVNVDGNLNFYPYRDIDHAFESTSIATAIIPKASEIGSFDIQSEFVSTNVNSKKENTLLFALNTNRIDKISFSKNRSLNNQISLMVNSLGIADKTNYDQLYQGANYTPGTAAIFPNTDFQGPMWVATQNSVMYNKQMISNASYNYSGAILNKQGLGFRGFTSVSATDLMTNRKATTEFDPYKMGAVTKQTSDFEESTFDYTFTDYNRTSVPQVKKMKLILNSKAISDKIKANIVTVTYSGYDSYGNAGSEVTDFDGASTTTTTVDYTYKNITTGGLNLIGQPNSRTVTNKRSGQTFIQDEGYFYYPIDNRLQYLYKGVRKNIQDEVELTSITEYNYYPNLGALQNEIVHNYVGGFGNNELTTSYTYDTDNCMLKTKTDVLGISTTYANDLNKRLVMGVTDHFNNTVVYGYNYWRWKNSEISTVGSDVITTSIGLQWSSDPDINRLITETQTTTGQPQTITSADAFGKETRKAVQGFANNTWIYADKEYDTFGRLKSSSAPYKSTDTPLFTMYSYDEFDRPTSVLQPNGSNTKYTYNGNTVSESKDGVTTSKTSDATGKLVSSTDNGRTVTYMYRPDGQPESINADGVVSSFEYNDPYNRQTKLIDPSAGTIQTAYTDATHEVTQIWDSGKTIVTKYNKFGQPTKKITPDFTTDYSYDPTYGRPTGSSSTNGTSKGVDYNTYGRLWKSTETVNAKTYQEVYTYDKGHINSVTYNTNTGTNTLSYPVTYNYNTNGYLNQLLNGTQVLRQVNSVNALGQEISVLLGNGLTTTKSYTPEGLWMNVTTSGGVQNMNFDFNSITGTLNSRTDVVNNNITESFTYDNEYRLKSYGPAAYNSTMNYNPNGNISSKSDVGAASVYKYNDDTNTKPYTLFKIYNATTVDLANQLDIDYTVMSRPTSIHNTTTGLSAAFTYNDSYDRTTMQVKQGTTVTMYKTYFGGGKYEIETVGGIEKQRLYVDGSPYSASVLLEKTGSAAIQTYYLHRDYLGSITQISNNSANLAAEYSYDAWGRMRNPLNWTAYPQGLQPTLLFGRGYTGHEHLNQFGIINMNARLYDPVLARFLAPDPYVGSGLTNDFNRYIYCRNNPLMYTDPSGETPWSWLSEQWNKFSNFMNKTFPKGFELKYGAGLPGNSGGGFSYNGNLNGNSSFGGNYKNGTFTTTSNYNGYVSSSYNPGQVVVQAEQSARGDYFGEKTFESAYNYIINLAHLAFVESEYDRLYGKEKQQGMPIEFDNAMNVAGTTFGVGAATEEMSKLGYKNFQRVAIPFVVYNAYTAGRLSYSSNATAMNYTDFGMGLLDAGAVFKWFSRANIYVGSATLVYGIGRIGYDYYNSNTRNYYGPTYQINGKFIRLW